MTTIAPMEVGGTPEVRTPMLAFLQGTHEQWLQEVRSVLDPTRSETAGIWIRWRANVYLETCFKRRFERERLAVYSLHERLTGQLASHLWALWVAEIGGRLVGNAFVQIVPKVPRPGRFDDAIGYLTNVYVEPELRARGVGTGLLEHALEWARARDLELLFVWPSERSRPLYARAGFHPGEVQELVLRPE